tara:strand:- start:308 stop:1141 length:834 start_codon:yes stop_codon:yes gene_type:complete
MKNIFLSTLLLLMPGCSSIKSVFDSKDQKKISSDEQNNEKDLEKSDNNLLLDNIKQADPFFKMEKTVEGIEQELDDLRARVIEYESKISAPTITTDILSQFPLNKLEHKITLENGTIVEGNILSENLDRIILDTKIGQIVIEKGKIVEREELADAVADVVKVSDPKISKSRSTRVFEGKVKNEGSQRADFVRIIFKYWDNDPIDGGDILGPPVAIDSAFVKGTYIEYLSGIVTDSSINPGDEASYRVVIKLPKNIDPDSPTHWTHEINWVKDYIPSK